MVDMPVATTQRLCGNILQVMSHYTYERTPHQTERKRNSEKVRRRSESPRQQAGCLCHLCGAEGYARVLQQQKPSSLHVDDLFTSSWSFA